jgi:hypothetical protein
LSISSLEGVPRFRLSNVDKAVEGHADTWVSFQDRYVTQKSSFFQARPWERLEERGAKRILQLEDEIEELEKKRGVSFGDHARFHAIEEKIAASSHEKDSLE